MKHERYHEFGRGHNIVVDIREGLLWKEKPRVQQHLRNNMTHLRDYTIIISYSITDKDKK